MTLPATDGITDRLQALFAYDASSPLIFSSGLFLFLFAGFLLVYSAFRRAPMARIVYVIAFSLYFYYKSSGVYFLLLVFAAASDFLIARGIYRTRKRSAAQRWLVVLSVAVNLGMLGYFKYTNFLIDISNQLFGQGFLQFQNIFLPVGISFFVFQSMSYTIDIYRGQLKPLSNWLDYLFYLSFFPQLVAGPDRPRAGLPAADPAEPHRGHEGDVRHGRLPDPHGPVQKGDHLRLHLAQLRRPHLRRTAALLGIRVPDGHLRLCPANLLRLLGLFGHGHRHGPPAGLPLPEELRRALPVGDDHRVLAAVAHLALDVAARLPLHFAGRQPQGPHSGPTATCSSRCCWADCGTARRSASSCGAELHGAALALHKLWMALVPGAKASGDADALVEPRGGHRRDVPHRLPGVADVPRRIDADRLS